MDSSGCDAGVTLRTVDFSRSFVTWRVDSLVKPPTTGTHSSLYSLNNARVVVDCRCTIHDISNEDSYEFILGASCKTEYVGASQGIWTEPNADYVPIRSRDQFMNIKSYARVGEKVMRYPPSLGVQAERNVGLNAEAYSMRIDLTYCDGELFKTAEQIVAAVLDNRRLVGRTHIKNERYAAIIEYPIKTINANERDHIYQPDTGPVLLPDLSREPMDLIAGLELAFIAFNGADWAEFIVRVPTPVAADISVHHYSRPVRLETRNEIVGLLEP